MLLRWMAWEKDQRMDKRVDKRVDQRKAWDWRMVLMTDWKVYQRMSLRKDESEDGYNG